MAVDLAVLKNELLTDPLALGYAPFVTNGESIVLAGMVNQIRTGAGFAVFPPTVTSAQVQTAFDPTEFGAWTPLQHSQWQTMLAGGVVATGTQSVRQVLVTILAGPPTSPNTRANIGALAVRQGSRGEVLFGVGTAVSHDQVEQALRLP